MHVASASADEQQTSVDARLASVEARLVRIEALLSSVHARLEHVSASCSNMDDHIGFVESVYELVRRPLSRLLFYSPLQRRSTPTRFFRD